VKAARNARRVPKDQMRGVGTVGSGMGSWEKSDVNSDKGLPFLLRWNWGEAIVACGGESVNDYVRDPRSCQAARAAR